MIYVIGVNKFEWAKIDFSDNWFTDEIGETKVERVYKSIEVGVPQFKSTFFNNQCDAEEMLENIKKLNLSVSKYLPFGDDVSVNDLKIFALDVIKEVEVV